MKKIASTIALASVAFAALAFGDAQAQTAAPAAATAKATFAGGCFWCVESDFDKLPGVLSTTSGYTGGSVANPTYEQVSGKHTGHAEVVQIVYDPKRVSYEQLLDHYWHTIDPTTKDRQFCDVGSPYRTAIFAHDAAQLAAAKASLAALEKTKPFKEAIVTEIVAASAFYPAEGYHQDYATLHPNQPYIATFDLPKIANLKSMMPEVWRDKPVLVAGPSKG